MKRSLVILFLAVLFIPATFLYDPPKACACFGTPQPTCARSIFLAKFVVTTIVIPSASSPINVPINVLPFLNWLSSPCAQPSSASVSLTLTCTPAGGGTPVVLGPQAFAQAVPVTPGPQTPAGPLTFVIPAGTFPPSGPNQVCAVTGTYDIGFGAGIGNTALSAGGDTEVCLVDPLPLNKSIPRLELTLIDLGAEAGIHGAPRGDQFNLFYYLANNDKKGSLNVDLNSTQRQTAILPIGLGTPAAAFAANAYSLSMFGTGLDTFPSTLVGSLTPGSIIPETHPLTPSDRLLKQGFILKAGRAEVFGLGTRSFGMCADGSCNENNVKITATDNKGKVLVACASSAHIVDDSLPRRTPLMEFIDLIKVNPNQQVIFDPGMFSPFAVHPLMTHASGNLDPVIFINPGTRLVGSAIPSSGAIPPSQLTDRLRTEEGVTRFDYNLGFGPAGNQGVNRVHVQNLNQLTPGSSFEIPAARPQDFIVDSFFDIFYDVPTGSMTIFNDTEQNIFSGTIQQFIGNPPAGVIPDPLTCRRLEKSNNTAGAFIIATDPLFLNRFLPDDQNKIKKLKNSVDILTIPPTSTTWSAAVEGKGIKLLNTSGTTDVDTLMVKYSRKGLGRVPRTNTPKIIITVPGALNSPLELPVVERVARKKKP